MVSAEPSLALNRPASAAVAMSYNGGGYNQYGHGGSNRYGDSSSYRDRSGGFGGSSRYGGGGGGGGRRGDSYRDRDSLDYIKLDKPDFSDLPPFEKRFYHEHPAVTARSEQEIEEYRRMKQIHVTGKGVPRPVSTFEEASFPSESQHTHSPPTHLCRKPVVCLLGVPFLTTNQTTRVCASEHRFNKEAGSVYIPGACDTMLKCVFLPASLSVAFCIGFVLEPAPSGCMCRVI